MSSTPVPALLPPCHPYGVVAVAAVSRAAAMAGRWQSDGRWQLFQLLADANCPMCPMSPIAFYSFSFLTITNFIRLKH